MKKNKSDGMSKLKPNKVIATIYKKIRERMLINPPPESEATYETSNKDTRGEK